MSKVYITTPIYYPNSDPHVGTAYTTIVADFLARYYRQRGKTVFYLTGTDENSVKVEEAAQKLNKPTKQYVDEMASIFREIWQKLNISYDKFIRTTDDYHIQTAQFVFQKLYEKGYIYKSYYEGWYCNSCETFWPSSKLGDEKVCPNIECRKPLTIVKEDNYFFKLSDFQEKLIKYYEQNPDSIFPKTRYNEVLSFIKMGLQDISVSRKNIEWGIKVPFDPNYTIYVWIDALTNYISGIGYPYNFEEEYWQNVYHIMGKDIIRFHAVIWPSILLALGLEPPKKLIVHGWLTTPENKKISKSTGGDIFKLREFISNNPEHMIMGLRYYLLKEGSFGEDIPISVERYVQIYNSDLANNVGNLLSRIVALIQKNLESKVYKKSSLEFIPTLYSQVLKEYNKYVENFEFSKAMDIIIDFSNHLNKKIEENRPWEMKNQKDKLNDLMFELCLGLVGIFTFLYPAIPYSSYQALNQLGLEKILDKASFNVSDLYLDGIESFEIRSRQVLFPAIK
ncbi:MAG: methionine--tRNA ligase [bacterium]